MANFTTDTDAQPISYGRPNFWSYNIQNTKQGASTTRKIPPVYDPSLYMAAAASPNLMGGLRDTYLFARGRK